MLDYWRVNFITKTTEIHVIIIYKYISATTKLVSQEAKRPHHLPASLALQKMEKADQISAINKSTRSVRSPATNPGLTLKAHPHSASSLHLHQSLLLIVNSVKTTSGQAQFLCGSSAQSSSTVRIKSSIKGWGFRSPTPDFAIKCHIISWSVGSNFTPLRKPGHSWATSLLSIVYWHFGQALVGLLCHIITLGSYPPDALLIFCCNSIFVNQPRWPSHGWAVTIKSPTQRQSFRLGRPHRQTCTSKYIMLRRSQIVRNFKWTEM